MTFRVVDWAMLIGIVLNGDARNRVRRISGKFVVNNYHFCAVLYF